MAVIGSLPWRRPGPGRGKSNAISTETLTDFEMEDGAGEAAARPVLIVIHHPSTDRIGDRHFFEAGQAFILGRKGPEFSRGPLGDKKCSSKHVELQLKAGSLMLKDLGGKNGTFVDGDRVEDERTLSPGDVFEVGDTFLQFTLEPVFEEADPDTLLGGISYESHQLRQSVAATAGHRQAVLIEGPTGAGKELIAREVHRLSCKTGNEPFVALNCSTLSANLAEAELFGYIRGAFTGADKDTDGMFQRAHKGTLFLDEVATLPLALQPKLLRALQEGKVRRVGGTEEEECTPRMVCATNEPLELLVARGTFRKDLYARLYGSRVTAPSLDARKGDIGFLADALLTRGGHEALRIGSDLMWALLMAKWPLNVRGLEQVLLAHAPSAAGRSLSLLPGIRDAIESQAALDEAESMSSSASATMSATVAESSPRTRVSKPARDDFIALLRKHKGSVGRVATELGVRRQQVYRWSEAHGLDLDSFR